MSNDLKAESAPDGVWHDVRKIDPAVEEYQDMVGKTQKYNIIFNYQQALKNMLATKLINDIEFQSRWEQVKEFCRMEQGFSASQRIKLIN